MTIAALHIGLALPPVSLAISYDRVAATNLATWSFYPGHSDPEFARAQGQTSIYLDTSVLQGFADRVVTDWAGPGTFIARRKLAILASVFPGDILTGSGVVERVDSRDGRPLVDLTISLDTQAGRVCDVWTTAVLPAQPSR